MLEERKQIAGPKKKKKRGRPHRSMPMNRLETKKCCVLPKKRDLGFSFPAAHDKEKREQKLGEGREDLLQQNTRGKQGTSISRRLRNTEGESPEKFVGGK